MCPHATKQGHAELPLLLGGYYLVALCVYICVLILHCCIVCPYALISVGSASACKRALEYVKIKPAKEAKEAY